MDANAKQQIVEKLKSSSNILICVSRDPSVDQLATAIGLGLLLNKLDKHATPVYGGQTPSTIQFLAPAEQLHTNTDSLQDFIISLDKSKADKLRYKVEDNVVKIFITPYKASLSQADLDFSQGDFNVDMVVALGVDSRDHLDEAIVSHGRILHDATVVSVMAGPTTSNLGSINWQEPAASSLAEMIVSISESFQSGLLDAQMSNAFLTGIVAETERFKNDKTTPKSMTMAAQLMAAGANQQLIADSLLKPEPLLEAEPEAPQDTEEQQAPEQQAQEDPVGTDDSSSEELPEPSAEAEPEQPAAAESQEPQNDGTPAFVANPLAPVEPDSKPHEAKPPELTMEDLNNASIEYKSNNPDLNIGTPEVSPDEIHIDHEGQILSAEEASIQEKIIKDAESGTSQAAEDSPEPAQDLQPVEVEVPMPAPSESAPSIPAEPSPEPEPAADTTIKHANSGHNMLNPEQNDDQRDLESIDSNDNSYVVDQKKKKVIQPLDYNPNAPKTDLTNPDVAAANLLTDDDSLERVSQDEARKRVESAIESDPNPLPEPEKSINAMPIEGDAPDSPPPPSLPPPIG